jgi:hypothetical protein
MGNCRFEHRTGLCGVVASVAFGFALVVGCATTPWSSQANSHTKSATDEGKAKSTKTSKSSGDATFTQSQKRALNELQQVGALDAAALDKLAEDLKEVDPSLRPMVLQTFLAEAAYRRRENQREAAKHKPDSSAADSSDEEPGPKVAGNDLHETRFELKPPLEKASSGSHSLVEKKVEAAVDVAPQPGSSSTPNLDIRPALSPEPPMFHGVDAVVAAAGSEAAIDGAGGKAATPPSTAARLTTIRNDDSTAASTRIAGAVAAPRSESNWQAHLGSAIRSIESESKTGSKRENDIALQARLRMLYLLAGRRDDAMRPLPSAPQATQEYWSSQIYGLSTWMDAEKTPDASRRAAETKRILSEALGSLGEAAPLMVRNLTFCTEVLRFGAFDAVKKTEFTSGQKVLVYAEIDNLHIESSAKGYHWAVKISAQVFDKGGNRMADYGTSSADEYYQTPRHDFFVSKLYFLPRLVPGSYTLQLTTEDTLGHKVGQSTIDFTVKPQ